LTISGNQLKGGCVNNGIDLTREKGEGNNNGVKVIQTQKSGCNHCINTFNESVSKGSGVLIAEFEHYDELLIQNILEL
jgi:hypothetical protein